MLNKQQEAALREFVYATGLAGSEELEKNINADVGDTLITFILRELDDVGGWAEAERRIATAIDDLKAVRFALSRRR